MDTFINLAAARNGTCLSTNYKGDSKKYTYKCSNDDHPMFDMRKADLERGRWCPKCSRHASVSVESINDHVGQYGFTLVDDEYKGCSMTHTFKCTENGHLVEMTWDNMKQKCKRGCVKCNPKKGGRSALTTEEVNQYLLSYGWQLVGDYKNARDKYTFVCTTGGHERVISWKSMKDATTSGKYKCKKC